MNIRTLFFTDLTICMKTHLAWLQAHGQLDLCDFQTRILDNSIILFTWKHTDHSRWGFSMQMLANRWVLIQEDRFICLDRYTPPELLYPPHRIHPVFVCSLPHGTSAYVPTSLQGTSSIVECDQVTDTHLGMLCLARLILGRKLMLDYFQEQSNATARAHELWRLAWFLRHAAALQRLRLHQEQQQNRRLAVAEVDCNGSLPPLFNHSAGLPVVTFLSRRSRQLARPIVNRDELLDYIKNNYDVQVRDTLTLADCIMQQQSHL